MSWFQTLVPITAATQNAALIWKSVLSVCSHSGLRHPACPTDMTSLAPPFELRTFHPDVGEPPTVVESMDDAFLWWKHAIERAAGVIGEDRLLSLITGGTVTTSSCYSGIGTDVTADKIIT